MSTSTRTDAPPDRLTLYRQQNERTIQRLRAALEKIREKHNIPKKRRPS